MHCYLTNNLTISLVILLFCTCHITAQSAFPFSSVHGSTKEPLDIHVRDENGQKSYLETHMPQGKLYLVSVWATWCRSCRSELRAVQKVYCDWADDYDVEFLAISVDTPTDHPKIFALAKKMKWDFKILHDEYGYLVGELGVSLLPRMFLVDRKGHIVYEPKDYSTTALKKLEKKMSSL